MPGLGWLFADDLPKLDTLDPGDAWPDAPDAILPRLVSLAGPVIRGTLLAGYRPYRFSIARAGLGTVLSIDDVIGVLTDTPVQLDPFPSAGGGIVIALSDLLHDQGHAAAEAADGSWLIDPTGTSGIDRFVEFSHALAVEPSDDAPWTGLAPGRADTESPKQVVLWSAHDWLSDPWLEEINQSARAIGADIVAALVARFGQGPETITPRGHAGLMWLANPLFWFARDATFPGQEFDPGKVGEPGVPIPWPQAETATEPFDPLATDRPGDLNLDTMLEIAGQAWGQLAARPDGHLEQLVLDENTRGRAHTLAKLLWTGLGLGALSRANRMSGATLGYSTVRFGGHDETLLLAIQHEPWIQALLALADGGVIAPAGYPADIVAAAPAPDEDLLEIEPVIAIFHEAVPPVDGSGGTAEFIELQLFCSPAGVPAATVRLSSSEFCVQVIQKAVTWDYVPNLDGGLMTILIVAGPGVAVLPDQDLDRAYRLEVYRVWDYESVPPRGARIQPELLLGGYVLSWQPQEPDTFLGTAWPDGVPIDGFTIYPLPDGVAIEFPTPQTTDRFPWWRLIARVADPLAFDTRIVFSTVYGHRSSAEMSWVYSGEPSISQLTMWVSGVVNVTLETLDQDPTPVIELSEPEVWRIVDAKDMPLQGAILPMVPIGPPLAIPPEAGPPIPEPDVALPSGSTRLAFPPSPPPPPDWFASMMFDIIDVSIGFIPIVGDVVDVAELAYSIYSGTDKWGRPVSSYEQMAMAVGVLVPIGSGAAFRAAGRATDDIIGLGLSRSGLEKLLAYLTASTSNVPGVAERALEELARTSPSYHRFGPEWQARVRTVLSDLPAYRAAAEQLGRSAGDGFAEEFFDLIDLLDDSGLYPFLPGLLNTYRQWLRNNGHRVSTPELIQEWMIKTTGPPRAVLEALFGAGGMRVLQSGQRAIRSPRLSPRYAITAPMTIRPSVKGFSYYGTQGIRSVIDAVEVDLPNQFLRGDRLADFASASELPELIDNTVVLLRKLSATNDPDAVALDLVRELMGQRTLEPDDLGEMLLRACKLAKDRLAVVTAGAIEHSGRTDLTIGVREYLELDGHRSFFTDIVTQGGVQHGGAMEVTVGAEEYLRLLLAGDPDPVRRMTLQNAIGSSKGPDVVRVFEELLQIVDSKAVLFIATDIYRQASLEAQAVRWVDLLFSQVLKLQVPDGVKRGRHWEIVFRTDSTMFIEHAIRRYHLSDEQARYRFVERVGEFETIVNELFKQRGRKISRHFPQIVVTDQPLYIPYR